MKNPLPQHLVDQWHPSRNHGLLPSESSAGSKNKVWWLGECGHEWEASINHRASRGDGCPYCSGHQVLPGFNDFATLHPELLTQWHPTKNIVSPSSVAGKSNSKAWWLGECGHEWEAVINNRVSHAHGCPFCKNRKVLVDFNDLAFRFPNLVPEWNYERNGSLSPQDLIFSSNTKVWWVCTKGHEWQAKVIKRTSRNQGCPICVGKNTLPGFNSLDVTHPLLAAQWHPTLNVDLKPSDLSKGSESKVWWRCDENHEWQAVVYSRTGNNGNNCLQCFLKKQSFVSQGEKDINIWLNEIGLTTITSDRTTLGAKNEIDIYLPELKIGIEFNGLYWHSDKVNPERAQKRHYNKWLAAKNAGVQLIQIWEDDWKRNPDLVKRMLAHKLGKSVQGKVFARKTEVYSLSTAQAQIFMNDNHIQGFASGTYYVGLVEKDSNRIVAVLILKREAGDVLNIIRYATSANVVGGFTKLIKHVEANVKFDKFITFADHTVSDGGLYENNGFVADKEILPDYMYVVKGERKHKFGYRLKRFRNDPELKHVEGLTERELALLNGLSRIWDAGKTRYIKLIIN